MYMTIKNEGIFPLQALTLAGFTTKRNDNSTIGQFGTGRIFAIALALRKNINVVIQTKKWKVTPFAKPIKVEKGDHNFDLKQIFFKIEHADGTVEERESSYTTDMGANWTSEFQIVREFYTNALDETRKMPDVSLQKSILKPTQVDEDVTIVYIKGTSEVKKIFDNLSYYFTTSSVQHENFYGQILPLVKGKGGIYVKRVLVYPLERSLFSYNFDKLSLNEERTLRDPFELKRDLRYLWEDCDDIGIIRELLANVDDKKVFETSEIEWSYVSINSNVKDAWLKAFNMQFGDNSVVTTNSLHEKKVRALGKNPVRVPKKFVDFVSTFAQKDEDAIDQHIHSKEWAKLMTEKTNVSEFLIESKREIEKSGAFLPQTLNTSVDFDENIIESVDVQQGVIVINPRYIYSQQAMTEALVKAFLMVEREVKYPDEAYLGAIHSLAVNLIQRISNANQFGDETKVSIKIEYDEAKQRAHLPLTFLDTANPNVFISLMNGELRLVASGKELVGRVDANGKLFALQAPLQYDGKKHTAYFKVPKRLQEVVNVSTVEFDQ